MDIKNYLLEYYIAQNGRKISAELARALVFDLAVTDGSTRENGEKYTMDEAREIGERVGVDFDSVALPEYYTVINSMYSDYNAVAIKYGANVPDFYGALAAAWFSDIDAKQNKTFDYYF